MNEIICPLLTTNTVVEEDGTVKIGTQPVYCIECQCAWWVEDKQKCAVAAIGGERHPEWFDRKSTSSGYATYCGLKLKEVL